MRVMKVEIIAEKFTYTANALFNECFISLTEGVNKGFTTTIHIYFLNINMNINISIEYLFLDVVDPVTHQLVQLTRGIQFVCKALVITNIVMPLKEITLVSKRLRQK